MAKWLKINQKGKTALFSIMFSIMIIGAAIMVNIQEISGEEPSLKNKLNLSKDVGLNKELQKVKLDWTINNLMYKCLEIKSKEDVSNNFKIYAELDNGDTEELALRSFRQKIPSLKEIPIYDYNCVNSTFCIPYQVGIKLVEGYNYTKIIISENLEESKIKSFSPEKQIKNTEEVIYEYCFYPPQKSKGTIYVEIGNQVYVDLQGSSFWDDSQTGWILMESDKNSTSWNGSTITAGMNVQDGGWAFSGAGSPYGTYNDSSDCQSYGGQFCKNLGGGTDAKSIKWDLTKNLTDYLVIFDWYLAPLHERVHINDATLNSDTSYYFFWSSWNPQRDDWGYNSTEIDTAGNFSLANNAYRALTENQWYSMVFEVTKDSPYNISLHLETGAYLTNDTFTTDAYYPFHRFEMTSGGWTNTDPDYFGDVAIYQLDFPVYLNAPENNAYILNSDLNIPLNWSNSTHSAGSALTYYLEVWNDTDMTELVYVNSSITETANTTGDIYAFPNSTTVESYFWRARANDGTYNSSWSELRNLTLETTQPPSNPTNLDSNTTNGDNLPRYINESMTGSFIPIDGEANPMTGYVTIYNNSIEMFQIVLSAMTSGATQTFVLDSGNFSTSSINDNFTWQVEITDGIAFNPGGNISVTEDYVIQNSLIKIEPISNIAKTEDFTEFNLDLTANISDLETADASTLIQVNNNNTGLVSILENNATSIVTFTAIANQSGSAQINLIVWDADGGQDSTTFDLIISSVNDKPLFDPISNINKNEDFTEFTIDVSSNISDVETSDANLKIQTRNNNTALLSVLENNATNIITFTAIANQSGSALINLTTIDEGGLEESTEFDLTIGSVNDIPFGYSINSPSNNSNQSANTITIQINNGSDVENDAISYYLNVWNDSAKTQIGYVNSSIAETATPTTDTTSILEDGDYFIEVLGFDADNGTFTDLITLEIDTTPPSTQLDYPERYQNFSTNEITFNITTTDIRLDTCELWGDWNGSFILNSSLGNPINGTTNNITTLTLVEGNYSWNAQCNDTLGNSAFNETNSSFTIDVTNPILTLDNIADTTSESPVCITKTLSFTYSITDNSDLDTIWYNTYDGASIEVENTTMPNSGSNSTTVSGCSTYTLNLYANDTAGNENFSSDNFTLTYIGITPPSGGGGGGGGGETVLKALNESCLSDSECISALCDLSITSSGIKSNNYGTCQSSLCGNGLLDEGENFVNCESDAGLGAQLESDRKGFVMRALLPIGGIAVMFLLLPKGKKKSKKSKKNKTFNINIKK